MQTNLRRLKCFELNTTLTVVLRINPNVIDESPSKLVENSIFMSKICSCITTYILFQGIFFFNCTLPLKSYQRFLFDWQIFHGLYAGYYFNVYMTIEYA